MVDPTAFPGWDEMLASHPEASVFHTAAWVRVLKESYGYRPFFLLGREQGSGPMSLLPLMEVRSRLTGCRGVCLPFSDSVSPVAVDEERHGLLLSGALALARERGWRYLEVRGEQPGRPEAPCSAEYTGHVLALDQSEEALFAGLRTNMKRNIRKSAQEGVSVAFAATQEAIDAYYRLHCVTRKAHGLPPQPRVFFARIREHLLERGMGFVVLARSGGRPVAGAVHFHFGGRMIYKFGASDAEGRRLRANHLVMWEAIRWGIAHGKRELSFGRTDRGQGGLLGYKQGFGAQERPIRYFRYDPRTGALLPAPTLGSNRLAGLFRRMPIPLSRLAGTILYRHKG